MDQDRRREIRRQRGLLVGAEVVAPIDREALALEPFDRVVVGDPRIRFAGRQFELRRVALEHLQFLAPAIEHARHDIRDEILRQLHVFIEREVSDLRLDHPEFRQMAAGLGFLGAEGRTEAIDLAEGERTRLRIELAALRQISLALAEVVDLEKIGRAFARTSASGSANRTARIRARGKSRGRPPRPRCASRRIAC